MSSSEKMNQHLRLLQFRDEAEQELKNILSFWKDHAVDHGNGGFFGQINNENIVHATAPKGSVLNGRILWTFSAAYIYFKEESYLEIAKRAYKYITDFFIDHEFGGVYWTTDEKGRPVETKKQGYACAFVLYGLSEYYRASLDEEALQQAIKLYYTIVGRTYDREYGGYYEAFSREWNEIDDQRLSGKDANEKKSTNTNLHVVEAFANLYKVWPDENLKKQIQGLLRIFLQHIIDSANHHLRLFFDEQWNNKPALLSYGHDIEAAWLLPDCAVIIDDKHLIADLTTSSVHLTNAAMNGLDADGGLWYEYDLRENKLIREKHWWPQAEALVGLINAWQLRGENLYAESALNCWQFIKTHLLNPTGEWYWGVNEDGSIMNEDKVGLWKCPYHNSRACLEIIRRLSF
jgi:mannobiose 2-epimerase